MAKSDRIQNEESSGNASGAHTEAQPEKNPTTQLHDLGLIVSQIALIASNAAEALDGADYAVQEMVLQAILRIGFLADCGSEVVGRQQFRGGAMAWVGV